MKENLVTMSSSIVIISVSDEDVNNYRKNSKKKMSILLIRKQDEPYKGRWSLPFGYLDNKKETLEECARKVLKDEINLSDIYIEQLYTFDNPNRDPQMRTISTSFISLVDKNRLKNSSNKNASWFDVINIEEKDSIVTITLSNNNEIIDFKIKKVLREKTTDRYEFIEHENKYLAFDDTIVILSGIERLKSKLNYTDIVFNMMPEYFTLGELQQVYEVILGKKLLDPAFRRIITNKVEKTNKMKTGGGHRPSALFKYKRMNIYEKN